MVWMLMLSWRTDILKYKNIYESQHPVFDIIMMCGMSQKVREKLQQGHFISLKSYPPIFPKHL